MAWQQILRWVLDLGWLFFLLVVLRHFWQTRQALVKTRSWLIAKGHVTDCKWTQAGESLWPEITYTYQVYEKDLIGHCLCIDTSHNTPHSHYARQVAYKAAIAYKEEIPIDVYYNPNDPNQSALDISMPIKLTVILMLIIALIGLQIGLLSLYFLGFI